VKPRRPREPPGGRPRASRVPPPSETGRVEAWAREKIAEAAPVAVHLRDGTVLRGIVRDIDASHVEIAADGTGPTRIALHAIRVIAEL